jgi:5-methylcytosine-specific restriction endonuclease McrBC GTP-binding regulatory subunit McrB
MNYYDYQKAVFDHLWSRYKKENSFRFSVRRKAMKGAEKNYFIGTEASRYFGLTFWDTPVYYPGSAADLTDFMFRGNDNDFNVKFQFGTSKGATGEQNEADLEFGYELLTNLTNAGINVIRNSDENKMLYYVVETEPKEFKNIEDLLMGFDNLYEKLSPIVDRSIEAIKTRKPNWLAGRFDDEKFLRLVQKMHDRIEDHSREKNAILIDNTVQNDARHSANKSTKTSDQPLNKILYGPPGTGKTYHTIDRALQIVDPSFYETNSSNRTALTEKFRTLLIKDWTDTKGQIAFVTFHQSMSYEDFVEGIKPLPPKPGERLAYDIEDGILKLLSKSARSNYESALRETQLLPFEEAFEKFRQNWEDNQNQKFPLKTQGYDFTITGFTNTSIQFRKASGGTSHTLSINTLKEQYYGKQYDFKQGVGIYYPYILAKVKSYSSDQQGKIDPLNFVLIIDEINRGNVAQIFGELITLVESDKRIGNSESLEVLLPYSKEPFGVPPNLYILGTMNTADRSVEAIDTALRRRFSFEEMVPRPDLLSPKNMLVSFWNRPEWIDVEYDEWMQEPYKSLTDRFYRLLGLTREKESMILDQESEETLGPWMIEDLDVLQNEDFTGPNLHLLLDAVNSRLEKLLSKDHQIGHAFFINVSSVEEFYETFYQKLVPQLQEYFYGDFGKIGLVLGSDFVKITEEERKIRFASFAYDDGETLLEKPIYRINHFLGEASINYDYFLSAVKNIYK